jgi:hypothetical protein
MVVDDGRQIKRVDEEKRDAASALVELGGSRTSRMAFAPVRHPASLLDFPGFLPFRSSPQFVPVRSRWGQIGGKCAKHTIIDLREQTRPCGRSRVRIPNGERSNKMRALSTYCNSFWPGGAPLRWLLSLVSRRRWINTLSLTAIRRWHAFPSPRGPSFPVAHGGRHQTRQSAGIGGEQGTSERPCRRVAGLVAFK